MVLQEDENLAFTLHTIFRDAVRCAIMSNRARGVPNIFTMENSLVCEYKNQLIRYKGQATIDKWIETIIHGNQGYNGTFK